MHASRKYLLEGSWEENDDQIDLCCCLCLSPRNVGAGHAGRAARSVGWHDHASPRSCSYLPSRAFLQRAKFRAERPLHNPPKLTRLVVGCLPSPRKHYIVVGQRAALENELRLSSRFVVDGAEVVAGKRHNKLSLPHDTPNFRSPPVHWQ